MKLLVTNDDGWDAEGLSVLQTVAKQIGDVWIVAPAKPMSGISHQITFEQPMRLEERAPNVFSLTGTPADCVRIGCTQLKVDFDYVLSGINNGANLGSDIYVSGTFAASREAALHGFRSIALSQHRRKFGEAFNWTQTLKMASRILPDLLANNDDLKPGEVLNLNFPDKFHLPEGQSANELDAAVTFCQLDQNPLPSDFNVDDAGNFVYCSKYSDRKRAAGRDIDVCFAGNVAITKHLFG